MLKEKTLLFLPFVFLVILALAACLSESRETDVTPTTVEAERIVETVVDEESPPGLVETTTPPTEENGRTLVICIAQEPDTLFYYGGTTTATAHVHQAIYDGPIDNRTFDYQPIILQKLPSLSDGDAVIESVTVEAGDLVVDDAANPVVLEEGVLVRPTGCAASECAVPFDGSSLEMEQMVVNFLWKENILWSDGAPLTANDSVYSFELYMDPDTPVPSRFLGERTASYRAIDDHTTVWTGLPGFRDPNYLINIWMPLPEHLWGELTALELIGAEESSRRPIGWGPFVIDEWVAGEHLTLSRNEYYWRAGEGLPRVNEIIFRFVGQNSNANVAALLAGQCDVVDHTGALEEQSQLLLELNLSDQLNAAFVTDTKWEHASFGINPVASYERPDFFEDVRTRQAIAHCMDRQIVVDTVMFGQSVVLDTYLPPEHPLFNADAPRYEFDIDKGVTLLEAVGWFDDDGDPATPRVAQGIEGIPDGTPFEFTYITTAGPQRQEAAQALQTSLAQCGIQINLEFWNNGLLVDGPEGPVFGRRFDIAQFAVVSGVQPPCWYFTSQQITGPQEEGFCGWGCINSMGWTDTEYDAACNDALQALPGTPEYAQNHLEAQRIFAERLPVVPLYPRLKLAATRPDLTGLIMDPTEKSEMWNIEAFDIGD